LVFPEIQTSKARQSSKTETLLCRVKSLPKLKTSALSETRGLLRSSMVVQEMIPTVLSHRLLDE